MPTDNLTTSSFTISTGASDSFSITLPYTASDFPNNICAEPYVNRWWDYEKYWKKYNPIV